MLQAVEVGLLQGLVDVEVGALAQRGWLGRGLWGVGAWPGGEVVQAALLWSQVFSVRFTKTEILESPSVGGTC